MNNASPPVESGDAGTDRLQSKMGQERPDEHEDATPLIDDLIVVSNRQPYRHCKEGPDGAVTVDCPAGGLTAGLDPVMQQLGGTWIAWGDGDADRAAVNDDQQVSVPPDDPQYALERLWLTDEEVHGYYRGYSNQALWPLCHVDPAKVTFDNDHWRQYRDVNQTFAERIADRADSGSTVWFQDYHLGLAPRLAREQLPSETFLMQFWHVPWPAPDVFRICPQRRELLRGLLGNDLLGFHTPRYCANFLTCVDEILDDTVVDWDEQRVHYQGHATTVQPFPMGVDADEVRRRSLEADETFIRRFEREHDIDTGTRVILGVDRLDYTKGIPRRLEALERLWESQPEWRGEFTYVQKGCDSRSSIPAYQELQQRVQERVNRLNQRFGTDEWRPVVSTTEMLPRKQLCELYRHADIALVSPLRDGMNLVAQEYVASQVENDGVLVLSEFAGAHDRLGDEALTINPYDTDEFAATIADALTMDRDERAERMAALRRRVHAGSIDVWIEDVLSAATAVKTDKRNQEATLQRTS